MAQGSPQGQGAVAEDQLAYSKRIESMVYRDLQKECKKRGLKAIGSTAQLKNQLLGKEDSKFIFCLNFFKCDLIFSLICDRR